MEFNLSVFSTDSLLKLLQEKELKEQTQTIKDIIEAIKGELDVRNGKFNKA